ncbi:MAG TPA: type II/IV secretion system ATPase subunit [Candidatus Methanoperedenaceae archaeon]|nr:type II/IV secretion system ATPase subunit [Candidatus Methanoperedenaceae archaeon]
MTGKKQKAGFLDRLKSLLGKKEKRFEGCPYKVKRHRNKKSIVLDCRACSHGVSTLGDPVCRESIFRILTGELTAERLTLSHLYERDYESEHLETLYALARFIDSLSVYRDADIPGCEAGGEDWKVWLNSVIDRSARDPLKSYADISNRIIELRNSGNRANAVCREKFASLLERMSSGLTVWGDYEELIKPYVRPRFSSSRVYTKPPQNAVFMEGYDVQRPGGRAMEVSIYRLLDRPESMYFLLPMEYNLKPEELTLLENVRRRLVRHRPKDLDFSDPSNSRDYFKRRGKQLISEEAAAMRVKLSPEQVNTLADITAKYTAGLGLLEDVLSDERVTDVYANAPVDINPLHIVVEGEECVSNIFFSQDDIDSMITRFRAISGRPFGEANPVLDMDLPEFKTRVSVIGNPLSAKGIAYAFRKHARTPWTLPKLISRGSLTPLAAGLLSFLIDGQSSILIAGGVGAGKTSLLSAMLLEIPQKYRILTIEDTPELPVEQLQRLGWKVQGMNTQSAVMASDAEIRPDVALRASLRMGSSTLVLGEVRGPEVKVLYEAMQVGTAGNSVLGTIHGSSTHAVFERIVHNLGVPAASFKSTDAVVVCSNIRISGTMRKQKRVVQIAEVMGSWGADPSPEHVFRDIMLFDPARDSLVAADVLDKGQSEVVRKIARKWGLTMQDVAANIRMRAAIKEKIANAGRNKPGLLEADMVSAANNMFWFFLSEEDEKKVDYQRVYDRWGSWYDELVKGLE